MLQFQRSIFHKSRAPARSILPEPLVAASCAVRALLARNEIKTKQNKTKQSNEKTKQTTNFLSKVEQRSFFSSDQNQNQNDVFSVGQTYRTKHDKKTEPIILEGKKHAKIILILT